MDIRVSWTRWSYPFFDHIYPRIIANTFSFPKFALACKKIIQSKSILESHAQTSHTHFWPCPPKIFLINFKFLWTCIKKHKITLFHWFVLEMWLIKKSWNLIYWEQFGPYLRNKTFPKYGICAGTQQIIHHYTVE